MLGGEPCAHEALAKESIEIMANRILMMDLLFLARFNHGFYSV